MTRRKRILQEYDLICIGGGVMSATLALMLKLVDKNRKVLILEKLSDVAQESSGPWNNAGTGHSGFCELNYTPMDKDGKVDIKKAIDVCMQFEQSKQLWNYLVKNGMIENPGEFLSPVPHHSWVTGEEDVNFLKHRYDAMKDHILFKGMKYSDDLEVLRKWFPLIMQEREESDKMAATRMELGTEVNYGKLTRLYFKILRKEFDTPVYTNYEVLDVDPTDSVDWLVEIKNLKNGEKAYCSARHVFIGAGGGALPLLQKVDIKEKDGYGGFPVSGQWLICKNPEVIKKHYAKVYSKAGLDAPPMSVPHLDTRFVNGKQELLFGPFAGFSTKFLKEGSFFDLFKSIKFSNLPSYWGAFWHNLPLTGYLIREVRMNQKDRMVELRKFIKNAEGKNWKLVVAGQRVQVIKRDKKEGGILEFGTEVVHSKNGRITALLGASPGASTAVHIMLDVLKIGFPKSIEKEEWQEKLSEIIPFWNKTLDGNEEEFAALRAECSKNLKIDTLLEEME